MKRTDYKNHMAKDTMSRYCTFNKGLWEASVPMPSHGIKPFTYESLGSYAERWEAESSVERFFNTIFPLGGERLSKESAIIMALRLRMESMKKSHERFKEDSELRIKSLEESVESQKAKAIASEVMLSWYKDRDAQWEREYLEVEAANKLQKWWFNRMLALGLRDETYEECVARGGSGQGWCIEHQSSYRP